MDDADTNHNLTVKKSNSHDINLPDSQDILYTREVISQTTWLYRMDALRVHNIREMKIIWDYLTCSSI